MQLYEEQAIYCPNTSWLKIVMYMQGRVQGGHLGGQWTEAKIGRKGANFARFWTILEWAAPPRPPPFWIHHRHVHVLP